jgi:PTS system N-acetylglucosamine-specific IIC component
MFLAPWLYALHALLTGAAMVTHGPAWRCARLRLLGGLLRLRAQLQQATHPLYLLPVGAAYFALYYFVFRWCIVRFDLRYARDARPQSRQPLWQRATRRRLRAGPTRTSARSAARRT